RVGVCCCERRGAGVLCVGAKAWAFAPKESFTWQRNRHEIQDAIMKAPTTYVTPPRGHMVDPFNPDQGFYGVLWGRIRPLTPRFGNIAEYGPGDPPREDDSEYRRDYRDVLEHGAYREELTPEQVRSGLFWAYDGARLIGTPSRIHNRLLRQIAEDDGLSTQEMARLLALSNIAMADASIVAGAPSTTTGYGGRWSRSVNRPSGYRPVSRASTLPNLRWEATRSFEQRHSTL